MVQIDHKSFDKNVQTFVNRINNILFFETANCFTIASSQQFTTASKLMTIVRLVKPMEGRITQKYNL